MAGPKIKIQRKYMLSDVTGELAAITDLTFNSLVTGRRYRLNIQMVYDGANNTGWMGIEANHNGVLICGVAGQGPDISASPPRNTSSVTFVAGAATITFVNRSTSGNTVYGNGTDEESYAELEDITDHYEDTTDWT